MRRMQQVVLFLLVVAFALLATTSLTTTVRAANLQNHIAPAGCWFEWRDTRKCCNCWWPGPQDWRQQWLVCPDGWEMPLPYYKCACPSWCGYK